jgi:hypothetical protein
VSYKGMRGIFYDGEEAEITIFGFEEMMWSFGMK